MLNFSWVIGNSLAASGMLGGYHPAASEDALSEELKFLQEQGIGAVVSLTESSLEQGQMQKSGLEYLHLPVRDMSAPTQADCDRFVGFTTARINRGVPTLVHCTAGMGRTGTMLAVFLVGQGSDPTESIGRIRALRPGSVETEAQEAVVFEYAARIKRGISKVHEDVAKDPLGDANL